MKVLFAVSNDNITTSVVSKYQQIYKEIITSKNVYYFNAIIKELQNDKTYDAIVIGEDLEPIANNNFEAIDKFLLEKLDRISDEASKPTGEDIPIIFICAERRTKSSQILRRLFSMSIYDALIGNDRSVNKVCALINKPRSKKEAKRYYQIETDQAEYEAETEELVSEDQIQSILNYYKKIGTNEKKCVEAFDSIAKQYDDTQLRIIVKFLPMSVKAILEINSQKYQQLMTGGTVLSNGKYNKYKPEPLKNQGKLEFLEKDLEKTKLSEPVVIPETMNLSNNSVSTNNYAMQQHNISNNVMQNTNNNIVRNTANNMTQNVNNRNNIAYNPNTNTMQNQRVNNYNNMTQNSNIQRNNNTVYGNYMNNNNNLNNTKGNYNLYNQQNTQSRINNTTQTNHVKNTDTDVSIPNEEKIPTTHLTTVNEATTPTVLNENTSMVVQPVAVEQPKRGRGRPRKTPLVSDDAVPKVKRGRGRPRKTPLTSEENINAVSNAITSNVLESNESTLPQTEKLNINPVMEEKVENTNNLQEIENIEIVNTIPETAKTITRNENTEVTNSLPGINDNTNNEISGMDDTQGNADILPRLDTTNESADVLPGLDITDEKTTENNTLNTLPGIDSIEEAQSEITLPGMEESPDNENNVLPGIEESPDNENNVLPGIKESPDNGNNILPGVEENTDNENNILPGVEENTDNENNISPRGKENTNILPGIEEINNNETVASENILPKVDEINKNAQEENSNSESKNGENDMNNFNQNPYGNNQPRPFNNGINNNPQMYKMNNFNPNNPYGNNPQSPYGNGMNGYPQNPYGNGMNGYPQNPYGNGMNGYPQNPYGNGMNGYPQNPYGNGMNGYPQNPYGNGMNGYNPQNPYGNGMNNPYGNEPTNNQDPYNNMFDEGLNSSNELIENIEQTNQEPVSLVAKNGKIALFVGTTKNGTSFIVNNLASILSEGGINTAILDLTKNRNAYYMFTDNKTDLMQIASNSLKNLENGEIKGIEVNKNLTVYTGLPDDNMETLNANAIIENVSNKYEVILLDCDFDTDSEYYKLANEIYLVQSMDAFTIQPLTKTLSELKSNNMLEESKLRIIINKYIKTGKLDTKMIIGGMSKYNEPSMTLQRDIFNPDNVPAIMVPFEQQNYVKYIEDIAMCHLSLNGYTKELIQSMQDLKNMIYPLIAGNDEGNRPNNNMNNVEQKKRKGLFGGMKKEDATFSNDVNNTLNKMRTNY